MGSDWDTILCTVWCGVVWWVLGVGCWVLQTAWATAQWIPFQKLIEGRYWFFLFILFWQFPGVYPFPFRWVFWYFPPLPAAHFRTWRPPLGRPAAGHWYDQLYSGCCSPTGRTRWGRGEGVLLGYAAVVTGVMGALDVVCVEVYSGVGSLCAV